MSEPEKLSNPRERCKQLLFSIEAAIICCLSLGILVCVIPWLDNRLLLIAIAALSTMAIRNNRTARAAETQHKRQLEDYQILLESVQHNPTAFAVYDGSDRLIAWNNAYESLYGKAFHQLHADTHNQIYYSDLVRCNASYELSGHELEQYVENRVLAQRASNGSTVDRIYPESGWFRVSKFVTPSGGVAGFAIDINELKRRETELLDEIEQRRKLEIEILALANTDSLTGIYNRRCFMENAGEAFDEEKDTLFPLIVLMVDIDHFKGINDRYGHAIGDDVIRFVAKVGAGVAQAGNGTIGRLGGEEFALTMSSLELSDGLSQAEHFRKLVSKEIFTATGEPFNVTISIGLAVKDSVDHDLSDLLRRADEALYRVKSDGRNATAYQPVDKAA